MPSLAYYPFALYSFFLLLFALLPLLFLSSPFHVLLFALGCLARALVCSFHVMHDMVCTFLKLFETAYDVLLRCFCRKFLLRFGLSVYLLADGVFVWVFS